jgi:hypothetical protein
MITRDNVREVFDAISKEDLDSVMSSKHDMCLLTVNGYGWVNLSSSGDFEEDEQEAINTGGVHCDKDSLLQLFKDSGSTNMNFKEYL